MNVKEDCITNITRILAILKTEVELRGSLNLLDINVHAENFYRDFFNLLFDLNLRNLNLETKNAGYLDLVDDKQKKAYQVTSQNDGGKITRTIEGFLKKPNYKDYELKVILIAKSALDYTSDFTKGGTFKFDYTKDVIDFKQLISVINDQKTEKLQAILSFLSKEVKFSHIKTETKEVETIMSLIEYLSREENTQLTDEIPTQVDPERKFHRFEDHREFLENHYAEMYTIYYETLKIAKENVGIDIVRAKKISFFLQYKSDSVLNECNNNPRIALDQLTNFFEEKLTDHGFICDQSAIRFYLLDELIQCNVFPNPVSYENANI